MRDRASITGNVGSFPQSVAEVIFKETFIIANLRSFKLHMKVLHSYSYKNFLHETVFKVSGIRKI